MVLSYCNASRYVQLISFREWYTNPILIFAHFAPVDVLCAKANPDEAELGTWVFRGYVRELRVLLHIDTDYASRSFHLERLLAVGATLLQELTPQHSRVRS